jgi:L-lactate dehydrogenase complex protein LldF
VTTTFSQFRRSATIAIEDIRMQGALEGATSIFVNARLRALTELPDSGPLRDHLKAVRSATLAQLAGHLETFESQAIAAGAQVHWARDAAEAGRIIIDIARRHGVTLATKSKSMATEEIHLNRALAAAGVEPVETDLGEWIIQLADEPPSHIIAPAIHKTRQQVAELFSQQSGQTLSADDIPLLTAAARRILRQKFLAAGMGISGANIGVAETGSIVLVTNEGNGRLVTSAPPVHVAVMGIEKIAPTWNDAAAWLALLARSATGQPLSIYTSIVTGPARPGDADGPEEVHVILLDNGRSQLVGTTYEEALQCIRCGACLNVCPVYREAGGHAYGSPYSGPIGAVVTPLLFGLEEYEALPHASSLCGACLEACPVRIDLPRMLLELRADEVEEKILPWPERKLEEAAAFVLGHERLMRFVTGVLRVLQLPLAGNGGLRLPRRLNPAGERQLPALAKKSFREMWEDGEI